jgi:hypothetical protein
LCSVDEHVDFSRRVSPIPHVPNCTQFVPLDFSMHAFEHFEVGGVDRCKFQALRLKFHFNCTLILLQSMQIRDRLTGSPELGLKSAIVHRDNVDDYGDLVYEALSKASWIYLFNY